MPARPSTFSAHVMAARRLAALVMLPVAMLAAASPAAAQFAPAYTCDASQRFTLDWNAEPQGSIGKGTRSTVLTNGSGKEITVSYGFSGDMDNVGVVSVDGISRTTPFVGVTARGGLGTDTTTLLIGAIFNQRQTSIDSNTDTAVITISTSEPVRDVAFTLLDIDYRGGQFADWVKVVATGPGGTFIPRLTTPQGRSNTGTPGLVAPGVAAVGPVTVAGYQISNGEIMGTGAADTTVNYGNVAVQAPQPVTSMSVRYANGPAAITVGTPGQQYIAIHDISFCPMPQLEMTKTSRAVATTGANRFNVPGSLVDYTLTVENTGGSPVDVDTATLVDALPASLTYMHVDVDPATAGTQTFAFQPGTSGLTLAAADVTYAGSATGPFTLTPATGANAAVRALRFAPKGRMAANSSFTIRFRARVN